MYPLLLGQLWLHEHDPNLRIWQGIWQIRDMPSGANKPICLLGMVTFASLLQSKKSQVYAIDCQHLGSLTRGGTTLMSIGTSAVLKPYCNLEGIFSEEKANELPVSSLYNHEIKLKGDCQPPYGPIYPLSTPKLQVLREYLHDNLAKGFIQHSTSSADAPILFVKKKDGSLWLCVDYRRPNLLTKKNWYPLPLIGETLDWLSGTKIYTKLDIRVAYNWVWMKEGDEWKTTFWTWYRHYKYCVMPFRLANALATFQGFINYALQDLLDICCIAYLDDILIYSDDDTKHVEHVQAVLKCLQEHGLHIKLEKCKFHTWCVGFVGYVVTPNGVSMEEDCFSTICDWPELQTHREVQVFLGFTNFYWQFVHQYSDLTQPLSNLLVGGKQGKFTGPFLFSDEAHSTFIKLKEKFSSTPMLRHFDPKRAVHLETNASAFAIAGILSQQGAGEPGVDWCRSTSTIEGDTAAHWHPIVFWSQTMVPAKRSYRTKDQEMLAIVMSLWHWYHYTKGMMHPVRVLTDHNNLADFLTKKTLSRCDTHWWETLSAYHLKILHRPDRLNLADAPLRWPNYEQAEQSNQPLSAGCECSPDGSL